MNGQRKVFRRWKMANLRPSTRLKFKVHALLTQSISWNSLTACMVEETEHVVCPLDADNVDALDWQERTTRYDDALDNPRPGRGSKQPSLALVEVELCDEQK